MLELIDLYFYETKNQIVYLFHQENGRYATLLLVIQEAVKASPISSSHTPVENFVQIRSLHL
ncbi:hypothetical protein Hanom_Chr04g00345661 [Helianthus anomalus]